MFSNFNFDSNKKSSEELTARLANKYTIFQRLRKQIKIDTKCFKLFKYNSLIHKLKQT